MCHLKNPPSPSPAPLFPSPLPFVRSWSFGPKRCAQGLGFRWQVVNPIGPLPPPALLAKKPARLAIRWLKVPPPRSCTQSDIAALALKSPSSSLPFSSTQRLSLSLSLSHSSSSYYYSSNFFFFFFLFFFFSFLLLFLFLFFLLFFFLFFFFFFLFVFFSFLFFLFLFLFSYSSSSYYSSSSSAASVLLPPTTDVFFFMCCFGQLVERRGRPRSCLPLLLGLRGPRRGPHARDARPCPVRLWNYLEARVGCSPLVTLNPKP